MESLGVIATSSVSSQTDLVLLGEEPDSKLDEARKHEVKIIDEEEFHKLVSQ